MPFRSLLTRLACLLTLAVVQLAPSAAQAAESYSFAVVPQFEQRKLFAIWKPIIDELNRLTGIEFQLKANMTVQDFERSIDVGSFDFIYANPYHVLRQVTRQGYLPLVNDRVPLRGILVVRKDSPLNSPAELDGKTLAIPSFNALGASLLLRADLEQLFKTKIVPLNVKTHSSVYLHVANGLAPAGGGVEKTLQEQDPTVQNALRVLYTTRDMPSHPISAHPRVPQDVRQKVQKALLDITATNSDRKLLAHIPMTDPGPTSIKEFQTMGQWGLEKYWVD